MTCWVLMHPVVLMVKDFLHITLLSIFPSAKDRQVCDFKVTYSLFTTYGCIEQDFGWRIRRDCAMHKWKSHGWTHQISRVVVLRAGHLSLSLPSSPAAGGMADGGRAGWIQIRILRRLRTVWARPGSGPTNRLDLGKYCIKTGQPRAKHEYFGIIFSGCNRQRYTKHFMATSKLCLNPYSKKALKG